MKDIIYNLHKEDISKALRVIADDIETNNCIGGHLEFYLEDNGLYSCKAMYRIIDSLGFADINPLNKKDDCLQYRKNNE